MKSTEWKQAMIHRLESIETKRPQGILENDQRTKRNENPGISNIESFTEFFEKLFTSESPNGFSEKKKQYVENKLRDYNLKREPDFTIEELKKAIHLLKKNKAAGEDRIPAEILKSTPMKLLLIILKLMNKIKNTCNYPKQWAIGIVSLILKEGNKDDPNKCPAITVIDSLAKVLAILIKERLEKWCKMEKVIRKEQIVFYKDCRPAIPSIQLS